MSVIRFLFFRRSDAILHDDDGEITFERVPFFAMQEKTIYLLLILVYVYNGGVGNNPLLMN